MCFIFGKDLWCNHSFIFGTGVDLEGKASSPDYYAIAASACTSSRENLH